MNSSHHRAEGCGAADSIRQAQFENDACYPNLCNGLHRKDKGTAQNAHIMYR